MHVLFLADGLFPFVVGGMQKHSTMLIRNLAPLVDQITVCTSGPINSPPPSDDAILTELVTTTNNITVRTCEFRDSGRLPGHYLRASRALSRAFFQLAGDMQHYDCVYAQGLTGDAFLSRHPRVMVNLHGLNMFQPAYSWKESIEKRLMRTHFRRQIREGWKHVSLGGRLTDILISQSIEKDRVVVIPNGIESNWILSKEELRSRATRRKDENTRFVMVGRNDFVKGLHVLRAAMEGLEEPLELHMIGDWPQWDSGIHTVIHHGIVREKPELMALLDACDVLLLPSLSEGMPTVVLEAFARGLEVIASDVGAVSELVPAENLVEAGNVGDLRMKLELIQAGSIGMFERGDFYDFRMIAIETLRHLTE